MVSVCRTGSCPRSGSVYFMSAFSLTWYAWCRCRLAHRLTRTSELTNTGAKTQPKIGTKMLPIFRTKNQDATGEGPTLVLHLLRPCFLAGMRPLNCARACLGQCPVAPAVEHSSLQSSGRFAPGPKQTAALSSRVCVCRIVAKCRPDWACMSRPLVPRDCACKSQRILITGSVAHFVVFPWLSPG